MLTKLVSLICSWRSAPTYVCSWMTRLNVGKDSRLSSSFLVSVPSKCFKAFRILLSRTCDSAKHLLLSTFFSSLVGASYIFRDANGWTAVNNGFSSRRYGANFSSDLSNIARGILSSETSSCYQRSCNHCCDQQITRPRPGPFDFP